ncbi:MAG TPA: TonB-dependent receptor [Allosphingosinicella sp.]|nr:TonB-dependent receptor [Allosphingosinicella sp.]
MHRAVLLSAASLFAFAAACPAVAQDAPASAPAPAAEVQDDDGEIVVTAQLREQRISEVPMAITAYSGEFLEELGLNDFEDVSRFVPGFEVQNQSPNNPGFVMRGVTSDSGEAFVEPRVSVFQDGVSIGKSRGSYVELFDIQRIEVVRGPQSTLYGRGALIGAVNIIQNRADPSGFAGFFEAGYGNFDYWSAEGMLNLPLGENAAFRVAGRYRNRDGYIENLLGGPDFNSVDTGAIRGTFHWAPSDRITVDIFGNYQEDHPNGTSFKSLGFSPTDPVTGQVLGDRSPNTGAALVAGAGFDGGAPLGLDREVWGVTGIVRAGLSDDFTLTSITAYREFDGVEILDADGISLPMITAGADESGEQFSQELRLTYDSDRVTAFVGLSYFNEDGAQRTPAQFDERVLLARIAGALNGGGLIPGRPTTDPAPISVLGNPAFTTQLLRGVVQQQIAAQVPANTPNRDAVIAGLLDATLPLAVAQGIAANLKPNHMETTTNTSQTDAFDIFADVTFRLSPEFEIGLGARYSHDSKTTSLSAAVLNGRSILGGFIGALSQPAPVRDALLQALAVPGAATIPPGPGYPVPLFGLTFQPTAGNGAVESRDLDDSFTWRIIARWAPNASTSVYANYARGRRPEVLSALPPATPFGSARFNIVDAETVDSFEVGARTRTAGGALSLDGALFYYKYSNFQTTEQVGTIFVTTNAGEAEAYGFEGQMRWRASPNATFFATYAWNHSRFTFGVRDGNRFRLSPDHTLSLGANFGVDVGPGRLSFVPSVTYQSSIFFDDNNDIPALQQPPNALVPDNVQDERQGGYALVNARLAYTLNDRFTLEAFVTNLFDEEYVLDAGNTGDAAGMPTFIGGAPRLYGLQASVRF